MNIKYVSLALSIIGIILLYFLSTLTQPVYIDLDHIADHEGKEIITQGNVIDYRITSYGNQIITITANNTTAQVFCEEPITIQYGDLIQATGRVEHYKNNWEIIVDQSSAIHIKKHWNNLSTPLWEIARNPERFVGLQLNTTGYIDSMYEGYFFFTDESGNHTIMVTHSPYANISIYTGQQCCLYAYFTYDPSQAHYLFELQNQNQMIKPIGA